MLGRAVKDHAVPIAKPPPPKQQPFSSAPPAQNGNIQDQFSQARQATKSIGGFTSYKNSQSALQSKSSNQKYIPAKKESGYVAYPSSASTVSTTSSTFSRNSSTASSISTTSSRSSNNSGLQRVLSKQGAFANTPDKVVEITHNDSALKKQLLLNQQHVVFDENDFDDDADLDIDMDYELPMSMAAPPRPIPNATLQPPTLPHYQSTKNPSSSAQTWSSSPPSHKVTPPGVREKRQREEQASLDSSQPVRAADQPRAAKRRTLPWLAKKAEEEAEAARLEELEEERDARSTASPAKKCFRCGSNSHFVSDCSSKEKGKSTYDFTPLPKDKFMPWNTTASKLAQDKKDLKGKQVKRKSDIEMEAAARDHDRKKRMAPITLSEEQQRVLDLVVNQQKSVFFTGSAGTGKSVLMRAIIAELRKKYKKEGDRVAVTASTGLAACNIGGVTLHSFGGIGLGKEDVPTLVKKIKRNAKAKTRWLKTKILVIDEISMVDGDLFDKLEGIARTMRNNGRPFGGIQLVITGDFFQLPPVPDYDNKSRGAKFAFDAGTWSTSVHHTIGLTEVFRQKDPVFANMLNEMRLGKITEETIQAFKKLSRKINFNDSLDATELFPTRNEVENANSFRMRSLAGKLYNFEAADTGTITDHGMRDKLLANMMAPKTLGLKKGSQVMLIKNMDDNLVNGSLGKVVAFMNEKTFEIYHENPDVLDESIAAEDLGEDERSQRSVLKATAKVPGGKEYPLVRFALADGTSRDLLVMPEDWKVELPSGEVQAQRSQLPLILAWALSIHKAQGQTLERVKIDLKKIFEKGQAYVALSRATSQAGLEVQNFDKSKVMAHPRVAQFYDSLYSVNKALQYPKVAEPPAPKKALSYEERFRKQGGAYNLDEEDGPSMAYG